MVFLFYFLDKCALLLSVVGNVVVEGLNYIDKIGFALASKP